MTELGIVNIGDQSEPDQANLFALNNDNADQLSLLSRAQWDDLVRQAFSATCTPAGTSLLIALDQDANYASPNFQWLCQRYDRFVYVDRVAVADAVRGGGVARALYEELFARTAKAGHVRVLCEVNVVPPNPASQAFHARMGFTEIETVALAHNGRTVRYLEKSL